MRAHSRLPVLVLAAAFAAAACTPLSRPKGEEPLSPEEIRLRGIENRLGELNKRVLGVENKEETKLQDDLRTLRGEVERLRYDLDGHSGSRRSSTATSTAACSGWKRRRLPPFPRTPRSRRASTTEWSSPP